MENETCNSCNAPCKCAGVTSIILAIAAGVGAIYTSGFWRIALITLAVIFIITAIIGFAGKFPCKCSCESAKQESKSAAPKKASKKKRR